MGYEAKLQEEKLLLAAKDGSVDPTLLADVRHIFEEVHALRQEIASTSRASNHMGDLVDQAHDKFDEFDRIEAAVQQRVAAAEALRLAALAQDSALVLAQDSALRAQEQRPPEEPKPARAPRNSGSHEAVAAMRNVHEDLVRRLDNMRAEAQQQQSEGLGQAVANVHQAMARMMAYIQGPAPQQQPADEIRSAAHAQSESDTIQVAETQQLSTSDTHEQTQVTNESHQDASLQKPSDVARDASSQETKAQESPPELSSPEPNDSVTNEFVLNSNAHESPPHVPSPLPESNNSPRNESLPTHAHTDAHASTSASVAGAEAAVSAPNPPPLAPQKVQTVATGMSLAADVAAAVSALQEGRIRDLENAMRQHMEKFGSAARAGGGHAVEEVVARMQADFDVKVRCSDCCTADFRTVSFGRTYRRRHHRRRHH
jgi:hypothetical protein